MKESVLSARKGGKESQDSSRIERNVREAK